MTVQQPHRPWPQLSRAPVSPNWVCSISTRLWCGLTSAVTGAPLSVNVMVRAAVMSCLLQRLTLLRPDGAIDRLRVERHFHQPHAHRVIDRVGDRGADAEGRDLADALGSERAILLLVLDIEVLQVDRHVVEAGDLVV